MYCHIKLQCLFSASMFVCYCPGFLDQIVFSSFDNLFGNAMTSSSNEAVVVNELCTLFALYFDVLTNMELEVLLSSDGVDDPLTTFVMVTVYASCDCLDNVLLVTGLCVGLVVTHFSIGILFDVFSNGTFGTAVDTFSGVRMVDGAG